MNRGERQAVIHTARLNCLKVLKLKINESEEALQEILEDAAAELGYVPTDNQAEDDRRFSRYLEIEGEIVDGAKAQLASYLLGSVYALFSFNPESGMELEFFSERPHTADGDRNNWPRWFRVYEGSLDGGDSILIDSRGQGIK